MDIHGQKVDSHRHIKSYTYIDTHMHRCLNLYEYMHAYVWDTTRHTDIQTPWRKDIQTNKQTSIPSERQDRVSDRPTDRRQDR